MYKRAQTPTSHSATATRLLLSYFLLLNTCWLTVRKNTSTSRIWEGKISAWTNKIFKYYWWGNCRAKLEVGPVDWNVLLWLDDYCSLLFLCVFLFCPELFRLFCFGNTSVVFLSFHGDTSTRPWWCGYLSLLNSDSWILDYSCSTWTDCRASWEIRKKIWFLTAVAEYDDDIILFLKIYFFYILINKTWQLIINE